MVRPPGDRERGAIGILPFTFDCIQAVSTVRLKLPQELHTKEALETVALTLAVGQQNLKIIIFLTNLSSRHNASLHNSHLNEPKKTKSNIRQGRPANSQLGLVFAICCKNNLFPLALTNGIEPHFC
jgi:hypothetical protein